MRIWQAIQVYNSPHNPAVLLSMFIPTLATPSIHNIPITKQLDHKVTKKTKYFGSPCFWSSVQLQRAFILRLNYISKEEIEKTEKQKVSLQI